MELYSFITAFFVSKNIYLLTAYICGEPESWRRLSRVAAGAGVRVRVCGELCARGAAPGAHAGELCARGAAPGAREGVLLDAACPGARAVLTKASADGGFGPRYAWLVLHDAAPASPAAAELTAGLAVLPDADVTWSAPGAAADLYREQPGRPLILTPLALQRSDATEQMQSTWSRLPTAVTRRKDLNNVSYKSVVVITRPQYFKGWSDLSDRQIDTFPKLTYPLMMLLAEDLHFRYNMRQVSQYGELRNGSFDGACGLMHRRAVDVAACVMFMRADRWAAVHYAAETVRLKSVFIFRAPPKSAVSNIFVLPLSRGVWAAAGAALLAAALLLAGAGRALSPFHPDLRQLSVADCFTFAVGALCQQGFHRAGPGAAVRAVMLCALGAALFLFTAYSAKVVALLQAPSDAVSSAEQLARSPLALAVQDTSYKRTYYQESREPAAQALWRRKLLPLGERAFLGVPAGVARVRAGLFAFQAEQSAAYEVISQTFEEHEKCGLREIEAFQLPVVAVPVSRHCGLRDLFATRLRWQRETGLMSRWARLWLAPRPRCAAAAGPVRVALADVRPALQVWAMGVGAAVGLLAAELALHRWRSLRFQTRVEHSN